MATKITLTLTDDQAIALIKLAAAASMTAEDRLLSLLDFAIIDADLLPIVSLDELLKELSESGEKHAASTVVDQVNLVTNRK